MEDQEVYPTDSSSDGGHPQTPKQPQSPQSQVARTDVVHDTMVQSATATRPSSVRPNASYAGEQRTGTPDNTDSLADATSTMTLGSSTTAVPRYPPQGSPRTTSGDVGRRRGIVFNDSFTDPSEMTESSSPQSQRAAMNSSRPRTRTMDGGTLGHRTALTGADQRHRVGSVSSPGPGAQVVSDEPLAAGVAPLEPFSSYTTPALPPRHPETPSTPSSSRDKKANRRLLKQRQTSRPNSPIMASAPSVDALCIPVAVEDPANIVSLMKTLCGRMRGDIEYQSDSNGPWYSGTAYVDDDSGSLMFDSGQNGSFHISIAGDLRGCNVLAVTHPQTAKQCIELTAQSTTSILLSPATLDEMELWLAALLCWQQLRPSTVKFTNGKPASPTGPLRPDLEPYSKVNNANKPHTIIKFDSFLLWDKGLPASPRAAFQRSSTRDIWSPSASWRRVSSLLHDNGELTLLLETDSLVLAHLDLTQLSRHAIQQLDRTVLDEEYCIAIFPSYASKASRISVIRPVYLGFDNRVHFEVWFVLLRAYAIPDLYHIGASEDDDVADVARVQPEAAANETFRMEKIITVRVTEAKIKAWPAGLDYILPDRSSKSEQDPLMGNYLAEVILDGEVRARTTTKYMTKNPFWREDCEFIDLSPSIQELSVVVKRVEGSELIHGKSGCPQELVCGTVHIALDQLERGKDHEDWLQIRDEKQQVIGSMLIKLSHEEHVALLAKEYEPLSEILHRFPAGLTTMIASSMSGQLRRLSELFLNIFQASGSAAEWLAALVEDEIDGISSQTSMKKYRFSSRLKSNESMESASDRELIVRDLNKSLAGEANLLFRGNTLLTSSLEFHMRRLGKEYLAEVLQDKIFEINELNPDCEVDPTKLSHGGGDLEQHWALLIRLTTEIWQCIATSASRIPPELRHILKSIRGIAEDRYGGIVRSAVYTAVSGFLFLRFICPAILSPKLFGLLRDHPRNKAQRTFTLIAKVLQKLSNLSTFGKREEYMEPMNRFLTTHRTAFREYIDDVCGIPAEHGVQIPVASYSTPNTIAQRLSPTASEGLGSLPYLIDHPRSFAGLVKLWVSTRPPDMQAGQVDGELLIFNDLCFGLQKRVDACLAKVGRIRAAEAAARGTPSGLVETLEQAALIEPISPIYGGAYPSLGPDLDHTLGCSGSDGADDGTRRRSKDVRRGREFRDGHDRKASGLRHVSGAAGSSAKSKNGKVGRNLLSGIMKMGGRAESPESKNQR